MKAFLLLTSLLLTLTGRLVAQQNYSLIKELPLSEITGSGTAVTLAPATSSAELPVGFDFNFWENTYSTFYINPQGTLSFEAPSSIIFDNTWLIGSPGIHNFIAFAWHKASYDFTNATVDYFTTGTAPNRVLVVNYKGVTFDQAANTYVGYPSAGTGTINVQIQLYEGPDGKIQIHSTDNKTVGGVGNNSGPGTVGIENSDGEESKMAVEYESVISYISIAPGVYVPVSSKRYFYDFSGKMVQFKMVPAPSAPVITSQTPAPFCSGYAITLKATGCPSGGVVTWNGDGSITGETFVTPVLTATEEQNGGAGYANFGYSATCTVDGVTTSAGYWSGDVYAVPDAPTSISASPGTPVDPGTPVTLTANATGTSWPVVWSWNNGANTFTGNPLNVEPQVTTEYFAARSNNGCKSAPVSQIVTVNQPQTVTIDPSTANWACGGKGQQFTVNYTITGTFPDNNFEVKLVKTVTVCGQAPGLSDVTSVITNTGSATLTWPVDLAGSSSFGCPATTTAYQIVIRNQGDNTINANYPVAIYQPTTAITSVSPTSITEPGQTVHLASPYDGTVTKAWYSHGETEYWQPGMSLGLTNDEVDVTPATSAYYSVVVTDAHGCQARSAKVRVPFNVTISGTGSAADGIYAEGRGVHLDINGIVGCSSGCPVPEYFLPDRPGVPDAGTYTYSTVFDWGYPGTWSGYFIVRRADYWEIYYGFRPTYGMSSYTRIYHTKNAFPTVPSGSRRAFRTASEVTGTRPPLNALWIKDADNSEVALTLTGVSEDYGTLPVNLAYFKAIVNDEKHVELAWETSTENNSAYFTVERSRTGQDFIPIGTVESGGNTDEVLSYRLTDRQPLSGTSYYRLKQTDLDGSSATYQIVSVRVEGNVKIYPNPSDGEFVMLEGTAASDLRIFDLIGRDVEFEVIGQNGRTLIRPRKSLSSGIYLVKTGGSTLKWVVK